MKIIIEMKTGNAAFEDDPNGEVLRILAALVTRWSEEGIEDRSLRDFNGNRVGVATVEPEPDEERWL